MKQYKFIQKLLLAVLALGLQAAHRMKKHK